MTEPPSITPAVSIRLTVMSLCLALPFCLVFLAVGKALHVPMWIILGNIAFIGIWAVFEVIDWWAYGEVTRER